MMSSRRLLPPRAIGAIVATAAVVLTAWWLLHDGGTPSGQGAGGNANVTPSADRAAPAAPPVVAESRLGVGARGSGTTEQPVQRQSGQQGVQNPPVLTMGGERAGGTTPADGKLARGNERPARPPESAAIDPPTSPPSKPTATPPTVTPPKAPSGDEKPTAPPSGEQPAAPPSAPAGPGAKDGPTAPPAVGVTTNADFARALQIQATDPVQARLLVTRALDSGTLSRGERDRAYALVVALAKTLFLNPNVNPNDPTMAVYTVESGDSLQKIVRTQKLECDYRLLKRLNAMADEHKLRVGQRLRVPKDTFNAEVIKSEYRLNLYLGEGSDRVMVATFPVGLGESNGTPIGLFKVRPNSKLVDPEWTHPRTGQHFAANDPQNPIGEHWIGLIGVEDRNKEFLGYGIHGTIEPDSIGHDRSLGCVRLLADDIAIVFECLTEPNSTILIK